MRWTPSAARGLMMALVSNTALQHKCLSKLNIFKLIIV